MYIVTLIKIYKWVYQEFLLTEIFRQLLRPDGHSAQSGGEVADGDGQREPVEGAGHSEEGAGKVEGENVGQNINVFQLIRFEADITKDVAKQWMMVTAVKRKERQVEKVEEKQQQMSMEEVFKMVNSQKEQMWQQERKSEESFF